MGSVAHDLSKRWHSMNGRILGLLAASLLAACHSAALAQGAVVVGTFSSWSLHKSEGADHKICFATSFPTAKEPKGANRAVSLMYVSSWPKDGVKSEFSVKLGYPIKSGSDVSLTVGEIEFKLFSKNEHAFVDDPTEELKLLEEMKKGANLVVRATSERGTATMDTYSLSGLTQALQAMSTACP